MLGRGLDSFYDWPSLTNVKGLKRRHFQNIYIKEEGVPQIVKLELEEMITESRALRTILNNQLELQKKCHDVCVL